MQENTLNLTFAGADSVQLIQTTFTYAIGGVKKVAVRGRSPGAFINAGLFQWTSAVRGLCILLIRAKLHRMINNGETSAKISGERGSLAASLDYAMTKTPSWIIDVFGTDDNGFPLSNKIIARTNSNLKRPGPVILAVNEQLLKAEHITVVWNERSANRPEALHILLRGMGDSELVRV